MVLSVIKRRTFFPHCSLAEAEDTGMGMMFEIKHNG